MSNKASNRPSTARKVTRKTKEREQDELAQGLRIEVSPTEVYEVRIGDVTPEAARELRAATGYGFMRLLNLIGEDPDVDLISSFVWLARRLAGEDIALEDVSIGYDVLARDGFDVAPAGSEVVGSGPEA